MQAQGQPSLQDLEQSFRLFNQMSEALTHSYQEVEEKVTRLQEQLATAQSERLQELEEKERLSQKIERVLQLLPAGVLILNGANVVIEANTAARQLLGQDLVGESWKKLTQRLFVMPQSDHQEVKLASGGWINLSFGSLADSNETIVLLKEVTETRKLQDALNRQQRLSAMGEMVAKIVHQVRTPLATATIYASHLQKSPLAEERRVQYADKLRKSLSDLENTVNGMLALSRGEEKGVAIFTLVGFLEDIAKKAELTCNEQGCVVVVRVNHDLDGSIMIRGNREVLQSAIQNLMDNSMEAGAACISLQASHDEGTISILLEDNGRGIDPTLADEIFEPFYTGRANGTGLGLAVTRSILDAHQGSILCISPRSVGACFKLTIPVWMENRILRSGEHQKMKTSLLNEPVVTNDNVLQFAAK